MTTGLDLTPTWAALMPALIAALQNGTPEGQRIAREELARLAQAVDAGNRNARAMLSRQTAAMGILQTCLASRPLSETAPARLNSALSPAELGESIATAIRTLEGKA